MSSGSEESMGESSCNSAFISGLATRPSINRRASTPAITPWTKLKPSTSAAAPLSPSSSANRPLDVASHSVRVSPKSAPSSLSSSTTAATHSSASIARETSAATAPSASASPAAARTIAGISNTLEAAAAPPSPPISAKKRFCMAVIPSVPSAAETSSAENAGKDVVSKSSSTGASVRMVATLRLSSASSMCARRFSPILPLTSSACAMTSSRLPYCAMSALAFLGPMPGTPGMLSDMSPFKP